METINGGNIYNSDMELYFYEFFENMEIDIKKDYQRISNNTFKACFLYVNSKYFHAPAGGSLTPIIYDYNTLYNVTRFYIETIYKYNIVSFTELYLCLIGISKVTFEKWNNTSAYINEEYSIYSKFKLDNNINTLSLYNMRDNGYINKLCSLRYSAVQKVKDLSRETVRGKLSDDRTGIIALANNDRDTGLEYENKRTFDKLETINKSVKDLPNLYAVGGLLQDGSRKQHK